MKQPTAFTEFILYLSFSGSFNTFFCNVSFYAWCQPNLILFWSCHRHFILPMACLLSLCPSNCVTCPLQGLYSRIFSTFLFSLLSTIIVDLQRYCFYVPALSLIFSSKLIISTSLYYHLLSQKLIRLFSGLLCDTMILDFDSEELEFDPRWAHSTEKSWILISFRAIIFPFNNKLLLNKEQRPKTICIVMITSLPLSVKPINIQQTPPNAFCRSTPCPLFSFTTKPM